MSLTLPERWQGCKHVETCIICLGHGCRSCGKRGVLWNRRTLPESMLQCGYSVVAGACFWSGGGTSGIGVQQDQSQVCGAIWELSKKGRAVERKPVDLSLLDGVPVAEVH